MFIDSASLQLKKSSSLVSLKSFVSENRKFHSFLPTLTPEITSNSLLATHFHIIQISSIYSEKSFSVDGFSLRRRPIQWKSYAWFFIMPVPWEIRGLSSGCDAVVNSMKHLHSTDNCIAIKPKKSRWKVLIYSKPICETEKRQPATFALK